MYSWQMLTSDGSAAPVVVEIPDFSDQSDAESWIGEEYQALLDLGVDAVTLLHDGEVVYANMSLHPSQ